MVSKNTNINYIFIHGGKFTMGNTYDDGYEDIDLPTYNVELSDFYISKYLVTFEEYDKYCESNFNINTYLNFCDENDDFHEIKGKEKPYDEGWGRGKRPVINVTWEESILYCNWLSQKDNLSPAYAIKPMQYDYSSDFKKNYYKYFYNNKYNDEFNYNFDIEYLYQANDFFGSYLDEAGEITLDTTKVRGYRLPTDAEWEYASKGGIQSKGYKYSGSNNPNEVAVYYEGSGFYDETKIIATKSSNELGLYDMSGNVSEFVQDLNYRCSDRIKNNYTVNPLKNIQHPDTFTHELYRVCRSGNTLLDLHNSHRSSIYQKIRDKHKGFRIVKSA